MPWRSRSAPRTVRGTKKRRQWAKIANSVLRKTGDDGLAKRAANTAMKKLRKKHK
jgi:hypothetical protein